MRSGSLLVALIVVVLGLAACDDTDGAAAAESQPATDGTDTAPGDAAEPPVGVSLALTASGNTWNPASLEAQAGQLVSLTIENTDAVLHSFFLGGVWADTDIQPGQTMVVEFTAPSAADYAFACKYHPDMQGSLTTT